MKCYIKKSKLTKIVMGFGHMFKSRIIFITIILGATVICSAQQEVIQKSRSLSPAIPISIQLDRPFGYELSDEDLRDLASKYQAISDRSTNFSPEQIKRLHQLNPDIKVVRYINFSSIFSPGISASKSERVSLLKKHPDLALKDKSGKLVPALWSGGAGVCMDPDNSAWREFLVEECYKAVTEKGYDGIMGDVVVMVNRLPGSFAGINLKTGGIYTAEEWRNGQYKTCKAVKEKIGKEKLLILNSVRFGRVYFQGGASRFLEVSDGLVAEEFRGLTNWPLNKFGSEEDLEKNINMLIDVQSKGKYIIANVKYQRKIVTNESQKSRYDMFMLAIFLMGKGDFSYFASEVLDEKNFAYSKRDYHSVWKTDIGMPRGAYYKKDGLYQRDFENGKVLANPTEKVITINLLNSYRLLDGALVSSITMHPYTGVLLLIAEK